MNKKQSKSILVGIVLLFVLMIVINDFIQPKIIFSAKMSHMSEKNFLVSHSKEDINNFKNIKIEVRFMKPFGFVRYIKIDSDSLLPYLKSNDKIELYSLSTNRSEDGKNYIETTEFHLNHVSEDKLITTIGNCSYQVSWKSLLGKKYNKVFYIKDYIK